MNGAVLMTRNLFTVAAVLCCPISAVAQTMGMGFGLEPSSPDSTQGLSSGFPGATYTPFERLRHETHTLRKHVLPPADAKDSGTAATAANTIDTDETDVQETAFRIRTTLIHPQPSLALATKAFRPIYLSGNSSRAQRIRKILDEPTVKMEFTETPLRDVVAEISKSCGIPVDIDSRAFEDAGLELDIPITRSVADVSLRSAIHLLLNDLDLTHLIAHDVLVITTKDKAAENLQVVFYPVPWSYDHAALVALVQNTVAPQSWNTVGGSGAIQSMGRFVCISQTEEVHDEVRQMIEQVCEADFLQGDDGAAAQKQTVVTRIHPVIDPKVLADLGSKLAGISNTALGADGDAAANVFVVGDRLVVQSSSRAFHVYAEDVIAAMNGVEVTILERFESSVPVRASGRGMVGRAF